MNFSRRNLVKTATWSVPTVLVSTTAPALATSPQPGLSGLLKLTYRRDLFSASIELTTVGQGLGLRVEDSGVRPTSAKLTIYLSRNIVPTSTRWTGSRAKWSTPRYLRSEGDYTVWEVTYTGSWVQDDRTWRTENFTFTAPVTATRDSVRARVVREAVVDGETYTTDSGYVTIGGNARRASSSDEEQTTTVEL